MLHFLLILIGFLSPNQDIQIHSKSTTVQSTTIGINPDTGGDTIQVLPKK